MNRRLSRLLKNSFLTEKYANIPMNLRVNFQIHGFFIILLGFFKEGTDRGKRKISGAMTAGSTPILYFGHGRRAEPQSASRIKTASTRLPRFTSSPVRRLKIIACAPWE